MSYEPVTCWVVVSLLLVNFIVFFFCILSCIDSSAQFHAGCDKWIHPFNCPSSQNTAIFPTPRKFPLAPFLSISDIQCKLSATFPNFYAPSQVLSPETHKKQNHTELVYKRLLFHNITFKIHVMTRISLFLFKADNVFTVLLVIKQIF